MDSCNGNRSSRNIRRRRRRRGRRKRRRRRRRRKAGGGCCCGFEWSSIAEVRASDSQMLI